MMCLWPLSTGWDLEPDELVNGLHLIKTERVEGDASVICGGGLSELFLTFLLVALFCR